MRPHFCLPAIKLTMLTLPLIGLVVFLFYQTWSHHITHYKAVYIIYYFYSREKEVITKNKNKPLYIYINNIIIYIDYFNPSFPLS